ncbi:MAG TPA: PPK2 family polyphosphate kinase [Blastocatellia bacterium]|nr:PPK2 family polyphosphate kinase [Blastocatellia bacterium]
MKYDSLIAPPSKKIRLKNYDPGDTAHFRNEEEALASLSEESTALAKYQDILMAHETYGMLILFQAMDGAGKDGTIKQVLSGLDPQGCEVKMFKKPTEKEVRHDYLWRALGSIPARGQMGIFNRSYYENVIADRIHPEHLDQQRLQEERKGKGIWEKQYRHINNFEQYLFDEGIVVLKFFLQMSKDKQVERLLERITLPEKKWKFSGSDLDEREHWAEYMKVYEEVFSHTSTEVAPWHIIPDDHRWFARSAIASIIVDKLKSLHSKYPALDDEQARELEKARRKLTQERPSIRKRADRGGKGQKKS